MRLNSYWSPIGLQRHVDLRRGMSVSDGLNITSSDIYECQEIKNLKHGNGLEKYCN